jgi:hypothetical protein
MKKITIAYSTALLCMTLAALADPVPLPSPTIVAKPVANPAASVPPMLRNVVTADEWQKYSQFNVSVNKSDEMKPLLAEMEAIRDQTKAVREKMTAVRAKKLADDPEIAAIDKKVQSAFHGPHSMNPNFGVHPAAKPVTAPATAPATAEQK